MGLKNVSYYNKLFAKKLSSVWGVLTVITTTFCGGFVVGRYFEQNLANKEAANMESEYSLKLVECENNRIREVVEMKTSYEREINELKIKAVKDEKTR